MAPWHLFLAWLLGPLPTACAAQSKSQGDPQVQINGAPPLYSSLFAAYPTDSSIFSSRELSPQAPPFSETTVLFGTLLPTLYSGHFVSGQKAEVIVELTKFVSLFSVISVLHCLLSNVWKQLCHMFGSALQLFMVSGVVQTQVFRNDQKSKVSLMQAFKNTF